jgi:hypothetical protein
MVNTKKVFLFLGLLVVSMIFLSNGVLAYWNFAYSIDNAARSVQPIAQFFLGGFDYTGQLLFERFLVFLIIFAVTFVAIVKAPFFKDQRPAAIIISIIVPLLSVRYIDFEWMNTILMTYQVFGIALASIVPFIIYFFFLIGIAPNNSGLRKIGWVLFGCVYLGLYTTAENQFYGQVYIWTALVAFLFLLLDGSIAKAMMWNRIKDSNLATIKDAEVSINRRMYQLSQDLHNRVIDQDYFDKQMTELKKQQKILFKHSH